MLEFTNLYGAALGIGAALCWSLASALYKIGGRGLSVYRMMLIRGVLSALFMALFITAIGGWDEVFTMTSTEWCYVLAATLMNLALGDALYLMALRRLGVALTIPSAYTYPVFTTILAFLFLGEGLSVLIIVSLCLAITGVWALMNAPTRNVASPEMSQGIALALVASLVWSGGIVLYTLALRNISPITVTAIRSFTLTIILAPLTTAYVARGKLGLKTIAILNIGGLLGIALGDLFFYYSISNFGATRAAIISSTSPLISFYIGAEYMKERITWIQAFGAVLITIGAMLVALG